MDKMAMLQKNMNDVLSGLKINAQCVKAKTYRSFCFFDVKLALGCRVGKIERFSREIALALKAYSNPIISMIPGSGLIRISFVFDKMESLYLKDISVDSPIIDDSLLSVVLGETQEGELLRFDMSKNPHVLIAGSTGSGKSTLMHTLINNIIDRNDTWLYLVDPKNGVEFNRYKNKINTVMATNYNDAINMLKILHEEMERRYEVLNKLNIPSINYAPYVFAKCILVIDELADLMLFDSVKENPNRGMFQSLLTSLTQKSRAAGIFCVAATQRPSVDVITGLIKANFPARISCKVSSSTDSKVILDKTGAEDLIGRGDAIINNYNNNYTRFQVALV